ncbi:hypothetical protein K7A41_01585 [Sphingobacterium sp. InxBP1]|uniref:hypothetical protein n=1 Tax=Sphingobacterium sp. InxBP1 TaxID=2870328 RepID=UPI002244BE52|nr:hypothetical protein [Sphingobacterium sp. InxBP1]MCW8309908.1 hypothetical protein [Sphingobacterium sp. InxBP1]
MGLSPVDYARLSPRDFSLKYSGFIKGEVNQKKDLRLLLWTVVKGYADPQKLPKTVEEWWPIDEHDKEVIKSNSSNPELWSDEKKDLAKDLIKRMTGG